MTRLAVEADYARTAGEMARVFGWLMMHHPDSRHLVGDAGGPDLVLLHPDRGWLFIELKLDGKHRSATQKKWAQAAEAAGTPIHLIRLPQQWDELERLLRG